MVDTCYFCQNKAIEHVVSMTRPIDYSVCEEHYHKIVKLEEMMFTTLKEQRKW